MRNVGNYVTRADAARTAAGALIDNFDGRRVLDVSGSEALTGADIASIASDLLGKTIAFAPVPAGALCEGLTSAVLPPGLVAVLLQFDIDAAEGRHAVTTDVVRFFSGQALQSVRQFLQNHGSALARDMAI